MVIKPRSHPNLSRRTFATGALAAFAGCAARETAHDDLIIHGGPIYSGLGPSPIEAVRFRGGVVAFVGALAEVRHGAAHARLIDLQGAAAFPGFVDSHVHLTELGIQAMQLDLTGVLSIAALKQALGAYALRHPQGPIVGGGWIETHWPEHRLPNRDDLDAIVSDRPIYLTRADGHAAVCNSAMLTRADITDSTPDPQGGRIERDAAGRASGILIDGALGLADRRLPQPTRLQKRTAIKAAAHLYASRGWTGVANMSTTPEDADIFEELAASGELPLKADLYLTPNGADAFCDRGPSVDRTGLVHRRGIKMYMDGALGSRGAALLAPYSDAPHSSGLLVTPVQQLRGIARRVRSAHGQIATHAIGDRANRLTLDLYRDAFSGDAAGLRGARWRIEHAQLVAPQDIARFGQMGVIASMQPSHCISDMYFAPARLGEARLGEGYAWKSLLDTGAIICGGTDAPVERGNPLIEFYAATYRHALNGFAAADWHLEEAVTRQQALTMFTRSAAYATFQESQRGTLEVGKRANLSAFSVDLLRAPFTDIPQARAVLSISEGRVTHNHL